MFQSKIYNKIISFREFLEESKFKISNSTKFSIPTGIKSKKTFQITNNQLKKSEEILECIRFICKTPNKLYYDMRKKNVIIMRNFDIIHQNSNVVDSNKFISLIIDQLQPKDFCFDYKSDDGKSWLYEYVIQDFKNDPRFKNLEIMNLDNMEKHLYIKFSIRYQFKDEITKLNYPIERSKDKQLYINPLVSEMMYISFHCVDELKK